MTNFQKNLQNQNICGKILSIDNNKKGKRE